MWSHQAEQIVLSLISKQTPETLGGQYSEATKLAALHICGSLWAEYYLRPNGEVVIVGEDYDYPETITVCTDRITILKALVSGAKRYPELLELIPARPAGAVDCQCKVIPF